MENQDKEKQPDNYAGLGTGITALIFSIMSLVLIRYIILSVILGIISVVFGFMSAQKGNGMGKAGLYIGGVSLFLTVALFLVLNVLDIESLFMIPSWYQ